MDHHHTTYFPPQHQLAVVLPAPQYHSQQPRLPVPTRQVPILPTTDMSAAVRTHSARMRCSRLEPVQQPGRMGPQAAAHSVARSMQHTGLQHQLQRAPLRCHRLAHHSSKADSPCERPCRCQRRVPRLALSEWVRNGHAGSWRSRRRNIRICGRRSVRGRRSRGVSAAGTTARHWTRNGKGRGTGRGTDATASPRGPEV